MKRLEKNENWKVSEVELVYRTKVKLSELPQITDPKTAYELFRTYWDTDKIDHIEEAKMLLLNRDNKVIGIHNLASGGLDCVIMDVRVIFCTALLAKATAIILAHNHPSGNLRPSPQDEATTRMIYKAGELLKIKLLDHVIITSEGYYSFGDSGLL